MSVPDFDQNAPKPSDFMPKLSDSGFSCSNDGFVELTLQSVDLAIFAIPFLIRIGKIFLPNDLKLAIDHFYWGITGSNAWIGYGMAALYYTLLDEGYGDQYCEVLGYISMVVSFLHFIFLNPDK